MGFMKGANITIAKLGMGCNVPAIRAARTLESDIDRKKQFF
jgi:Fe2+ transport system protein B